MDNIKLLCPVCAGKLVPGEKSFHCIQGHSFDKARQGYLNLLPVQQKHSLNPGDTKEMLLARRSFLNTGHYLPVAEQVTEAINKYVRAEKPSVIDVGCGEGYYTELLSRRCPGVYTGVDISKDGVRMACSRSRDILWLVATASSLPVENASMDCLVTMFSLLMPKEYGRVLKPGGCLIEVTVGNDHLRELKEIVYDEVFEQNKHPAELPSPFEQVLCSEHRYRITLNNAELCDLLKMTPHFWRIHKERRELLESTDSLALTVHYWLRAAVKKQED